MEILRKRTRNLCECSTCVDDGGVVVHKHMEFHMNVDLKLMIGAADDDTFGRQQKRKCNGVSSYISQLDHISVPDTCLPSLAASVRDETVAMVTDSDATSYHHSHNIPHSAHNSCHVTGAGDANNSSKTFQSQNPVRKVCQRCLSGEPGHITHIVS